MFSANSLIRQLHFGSCPKCLVEFYKRVSFNCIEYCHYIKITLYKTYVN